jgi:hypothetical protein
MSSGVSISVTGLKEVDAVLKGLPLQFQDRVLKAAHADAAKPLISAAQGLAPVGKTGNLRRSIGVERISLKKTNEVGLERPTGTEVKQIQILSCSPHLSRQKAR